MLTDTIWHSLSVTFEYGQSQRLAIRFDDGHQATYSRTVIARVGNAQVHVTVTLTPIDHYYAVSVSLHSDTDIVLRTQLTLSVHEVGVPHVMIPGLFYGENRPADCDRIFPRFVPDTERPDALVSDHWSFRADRCATPSVFMWTCSETQPATPTDNNVPLGNESSILGGWAIVTTETSPAGETGVGFSYRDGVAAIHLRFPYREEPVTYYGSDEPLPSMQQDAFLLCADCEVEFRGEIYPLSKNRHDYAPILRDVYERWKATHPLQPWVSVADAADLASIGLNRWHFDPDPGILLETVGFDRGIGVDGVPVDRQAMHIAWVSGIPWAYAMLMHGRRVGDNAECEAALRVIDFVCSSLSPSGSFWGVWYRQHGWSGSWTPLVGGIHARTLGEATLFLTRALRLEYEHGRGIQSHPSWVKAMCSNLTLMLKRQREDGNLGAVHHAQTGEVLNWRGAAGLIWIAAFVELAELVESSDCAELLPSGVSVDDLLTAAKRAAGYYESFVNDECIYGAPEDVDLAPTSEDGYCAVMAYVALYRCTRDPHWFDVAQRAADWMLTFRYTYNVAFGEHTFLGQYDFRTRGGDQASPSNQHLHSYGLVCNREMRELSAYTGDSFWEDRADEVLACFRQMIARCDGDINAYQGMISERYYQTECFQPKGMLLTLSHAWCCGVLLLACEQQLSCNEV